MIAKISRFMIDLNDYSNCSWLNSFFSWCMKCCSSPINLRHLLYPGSAFICIWKCFWSINAIVSPTGRRQSHSVRRHTEFLLKQNCRVWNSNLSSDVGSLMFISGSWKSPSPPHICLRQSTAISMQVWPVSILQAKTRVKCWNVV